MLLPLGSFGDNAAARLCVAHIGCSSGGDRGQEVRDFRPGGGRSGRSDVLIGSPCRKSTRSSQSPKVSTTSTRTEARAATRHAPRPQAVPRAAVTQIVAAVVM